MKVVIISRSYLFEHHQQKLEEMSGYKDLELTLISPERWDHQLGDIRLERKSASKYRIIPRRIFFNGNYTRYFYPGLGRTLKALKPDIVQIEDEPWYLSTYLIMRFCRRHLPHTKIIFLTWESIFRKYRFPLSFYQRYALRNADCAIVGNREIAGVLARKGFARRIEVIPLGLDPSFFRPGDSGALKAELGLEPFTIGYIGRLIEMKGLSMLLQAVSKLNIDYRLLIAGEGDYRNRIEKESKELGISEKVVVIDRVEHSKVPEYINCLDVLVLPSLTTSIIKEQFGRILIEAMACGVPVIGSDSGEIPNVIGDGGFVFREGDEEDLTSRLHALAQDPELRRGFAQRGRKRVLANFTHERIARMHYDVYQRLDAARIGFILYRFPIFSETFVFDEINTLKNKGIDATIFSLQRPADDVIHEGAERLLGDVVYAQDPKSGTEAFFSVLSANVMTFLSSPIEYARCFRNYFFRIGKKEFLQIFHLCRAIKKRKIPFLYAHFANTPATAAMIISEFLKIPYGIAVHGRDVFVVDELLGEKLKKAKLIVANSEYFKRHLLERYPTLDGSKIKVIYYAVDMDRFAPFPIRPEGAISILDGARFVEKKGFSYLLKACRLLADRGMDFNCKIYGYGPLEEELRSQVSGLGLEDKISFKGPVKRDELSGLLAESDMFVSPHVIAGDGDRDGIPITLILAMASARPVIATDISAIPELITSGQDGVLVPQRDEKKLADAIVTLAVDREMRSRMGRKARAKVEEKFNLEKNTTMLAGLFKDSTIYKYDA